MINGDCVSIKVDKHVPGRLYHGFVEYTNVTLFWPSQVQYFDVVVGLTWSYDPNSYVGGSLTTGRISYARQVKERWWSKQKGIPWSSRFGVSRRVGSSSISTQVRESVLKTASVPAPSRFGGSPLSVDIEAPAWANWYEGVWLDTEPSQLQTQFASAGITNKICREE